MCLHKFGNEVFTLLIISKVTSSGYSVNTFFLTHLLCLFLIFCFFVCHWKTVISMGRSFLSMITCKSGHEGHSFVAHVGFHVRGLTEWPSVHITLNDICLLESGSNCSFPFQRILFIALTSLLAFALIGQVLCTISCDVSWTAYGGNSLI